MGTRETVTGALEPSPALRRADLLSIITLIAAVLLPVGPVAAWLRGAYSATDADLRAGVWILKASVVALGIAAILVRRLPQPPAPYPEHPRTDPTSTWIIAGLLAVALALRVYRLDTELWMDEIFLRTRYAPLEFRQLLSTYDSQNHQPFYSLLARFSFLVAGGSDWSLRVPALVMGVASLWALWWFGRRVTSRSEALVAVAILAVSYHHIWFSQNARGYTAMMLLTVLSTGTFLRLCEGAGQARRLTWTYAVLMALATYTHLTAAFVAVGHAVTLLLLTPWRSGEARRRATWPAAAVALSAVLTIVMYAPMLPQVWRQITTPTMAGVTVEWTGAGWMVREALRVLGEGIPGGLLTVAVALIVLGVGVVSFWRQSRLTTLLMFLPVGVTLVAILAARHNLWPRFFFFASGFLVLAALRGGFVLVRWLVRWQPERVAVAGAIGVALLSLLTVPRAWQPKQQFRAAMAFIAQERQPGDEVIALDVASEIYRLRGWAPDWRSARDVATLSDTERSARRAWIVFTLPARLRAVTPELYQHVSGPRYQVVRIFPATVGGGEIHVLRHDSTSTDD